MTQPDPGAARAREFLEGHDLLGRLTQEEMDEALQHAHIRRLPSSHPLFEKGDPGDGLFAILNGQIKISTLSESGKEASKDSISSWSAARRSASWRACLSSSAASRAAIT